MVFTLLSPIIHHFIFNILVPALEHWREKVLPVQTQCLASLAPNPEETQCIWSVHFNKLLQDCQNSKFGCMKRNFKSLLRFRTHTGAWVREELHLVHDPLITCPLDHFSTATLLIWLLPSVSSLTRYRPEEKTSVSHVT